MPQQHALRAGSRPDDDREGGGRARPTRSASISRTRWRRTRRRQGRANVVRALQQIDFGARVRIVRINALDTPFAYRDLVEVVEAAGDRLDLVMLPEGGVAGRRRVRGHAAHADRGAAAACSTRIGIEAQIETARGFLYAREIASASPRLEALIFGPGDYAASMQMPATGIGEFDARTRSIPVTAGTP